MRIDEAARNLFSEYATNGLTKINSDLAQGSEEGENLDFKRCNSNGANLHKDDKVNFAELASAFANNSGGVLVWGVDCAKNSQGIDAVTKLVPFDNLLAFRSALRSQIAVILQPGVNGVEFLPILETGKTDSGYLVVFIPASTGEPVRAAATNTHRYYIRISDQSQVMPHSTLADRFGRRPQPKLALGFWLSASGRSGPDRWYSYDLSLTNEGRGIAKYPLARIQRVSGISMFRDSNAQMIFNRTTIDPSRYGESTWTAAPGVVVQPGTHVQITSLTVTVPNGATSVDLEVPFTLLCDGDRFEDTLQVATGSIQPNQTYVFSRKE